MRSEALGSFGGAGGSVSLEELIRTWNGLAVVTRYDEPTDAWIFIALHDDTLGLPVGGTRLQTYDSPDDGLRDAMRLAEGMTHKWAAIEFPRGGAKAVLALSRPVEGEARTGLLRRYGTLLRRLEHSFGTGQDLGISPEDMLVVAQETISVHGVDVVQGTARDAGPYTARGTYAGIRAALAARFGTADVKGRRVVVQGCGDVGRPLAELLADADAKVVVCDVVAERARALASDIDCEVVTPDVVVETPCDVHAPCSVGATLNEETIPKLGCAIVAGCANNQLATPDDAERLAERGILWAPDYVINAGGAIAFGLLQEGTAVDDEIIARIDGIEGSLTEIFKDAAEREETPLRAARRRVDAVLAAAREGHTP